jgi:hypothetical protein
LPEIYHLILVELKISDPKYLNCLLFLKGGPQLSLELPPPFEISGTVTVKFGFSYTVGVLDNLSLSLSFFFFYFSNGVGGVATPATYPLESSID